MYGRHAMRRVQKSMPGNVARGREVHARHFQALVAFY